MNNIDRIEYMHLRKCFEDILVYPILGENYYNSAVSICGSDLECCKEIRNRYNCLETKVGVYRMLFIIAFIGLMFVIIFD